MSSGFPSQVNTSTTTTTTTSHDQTLYLNTGFIKTLHGYIKIIQLILCLLAFICIESVHSSYRVSYPSEVNFLNFVVITGMLVAAILFFFYFINLVVFATMIPWVLVEMGFNFIWCFFCFVGGILASVGAGRIYVLPNNDRFTLEAPYGAAAFFLFVAMCVYGFYGFRLFLLHRQGISLVVVSTETIRSTSTQQTFANGGGGA